MRIWWGYKGNDSTRQTPVIFVSCSSRGSFLQRNPASLALSSAHTCPICKTTKANVQLLCAESCRSHFGEILEFKQNFAIRTFAEAVNNSLAFLVIFRQRPR